MPKGLSSGGVIESGGSLFIFGGFAGGWNLNTKRYQLVITTDGLEWREEPWQAGELGKKVLTATKFSGGCLDGKPVFGERDDHRCGSEHRFDDGTPGMCNKGRYCTDAGWCKQGKVWCQ